MSKLSIVILSYNTKDLTSECIKSVAAQYGKELEESPQYVGKLYGITQNLKHMTTEEKEYWLMVERMYRGYLREYDEGHHYVDEVEPAERDVTACVDCGWLNPNPTCGACG